MNSKLISMRSFCKTFLVCLAAFVAGRILIFPGFLDPQTPSHDDLYRYFLIGQSVWTPDQWLSPRPLMLIFLHLLGGLVDVPRFFWLGLSLTSVFFVAALVEFLKKAQLGSIDALSTFIFGVIIFALPSSWEIYQLDFGGMLSGVFCVISAFVYLRGPKESAFSGAIILSLILFWVALETKPTFAAVMLLLAGIDFVITRSRKSLFALFGIIAISFLVVVKDKLLGSPFINFNSAGNYYEVKILSLDNLVALQSYLKASASPYLIPALVLLYFTVARKDTTRPSVIIYPALAIAAVLPMTIIPNRVLTLYSWYASVFLFAPCLFITFHALTNESLIFRYKANLVVILLVAGMLAHAHKSFPVSAYAWSLSQTNRNVANSLEYIKDDRWGVSTKKVIITGLQGPSHAFRQSDFVLDQTMLNSYTLLLRNSEAPWNNEARALGKTEKLSGIDYEDYDFYYVYDSKGRLAYKLSKSEMLSIPEWWRDAVVTCASSPFLSKLSKKDYENALACFDYANESAAATNMYEKSDIRNALGASGFFHLANAYRKSGLLDQSRNSLLKALTFGENRIFRQSLNTLESEIRNVNQRP